MHQRLTYDSFLLSGPLVRIGPDEIHCNDAAFVDEIYASGARKRDKQAHYLGVLAGPTTKTAFGTADHDLHRVRRNAMNKFFSHAQITRLEPEITHLVQLLCDKLLSMIPPVLERSMITQRINLMGFNCSGSDTFVYSKPVRRCMM